MFCIPMCVICAVMVVVCVTMLHLVVFILGGHCYGAAMEFFNDDSHVSLSLRCSSYALAMLSGVLTAGDMLRSARCHIALLYMIGL